MKTGISIVVFSIIIHFITPSWFYSDFIKIADWIVLLSACTTILFRISEKNNRNGILLDHFVAYNTLMYFMTTARTDTLDSGNEAAFYRLAAIFSTEFKYVKVGIFFEYFNMLEVAANILLTIVLISFMKRHKSATNMN